MSENISQIQAAIAATGARLFDRNILDLAGGNISVRIDAERVAITPRYSGPNYHWRLKPEDVMVVTLEGEILEGTGQLSRESKVHLRLHQEFGAHGQAVVHAHARNVMVFAAQARTIPSVMEATRKFGEIQVAQYAPSHTTELSEYIAAGIRGQEKRIEKHAAAVIAPYHGIFAMGKDLDLTSDAIERIDTNAFCLLMGRLLNPGGDFNTQHEGMEAAVREFERQHAEADLGEDY